MLYDPEFGGAYCEITASSAQNCTHCTCLATQVFGWLNGNSRAFKGTQTTKNWTVTQIVYKGPPGYREAGCWGRARALPLSPHCLGREFN